MLCRLLVWRFVAGDAVGVSAGCKLSKVRSFRQDCFRETGAFVNAGGWPSQINAGWPLLHWITDTGDLTVGHGGRERDPPDEQHA